MSDKPKIAIIGAGPAGATLARLLYLNGVDFEIFEGEASDASRKQGSSLDLHHDTGQAALKKANLWTEFENAARYDSEATAIVDKKYLIYMKSPGGDKARKYTRPEIDRAALRRVLIESLPEGKIQWNHHLKSVSEDGTLTFAEQGTKGPFDLVIGCEGAWSKVRPLLTDVKPEYVGIGGISVTINNPDKHCPELLERLRKGSIFAFSDCKSMGPQHLGSGSINLYTWFKVPEDWQEKLTFDPRTDMEAVNRFLADEIYADWHPRLKDYLVQGNEEHEARNMYMLPVGLTFEHRKGFTIIGDAAHLMTPFAGEGVNLAMRDAMELAQAIAQGIKDDDLDGAVQKFEEEMFVHSKPFQQNTLNNFKGFFSEDPKAIQRTVGAMLDRFKPRIPPRLFEYLENQKNNPTQGP